MAEVASAYVSLIPSARGFTKGVTKETDAAARTAGKRFGGIFSGSLKSVIGGALAGIGVTRLLGDALGEAREAQKVGALTTQVIKSTGGAANVSAEQVGNLATAISNKVGIDDEAIQSGENLLLTFKNIRNEAGKGNKIFDQATHATVDLAAALAAASGGELDFRSASTLVGKALNDPVKGVTALTRVGVTFTDKQKEQIKALVESGKTMDAQKIILRELKSEFGGAAKAQATDADKARVALGNLEEQIGTALLPVVDDLAQKFTKDVVPAISEFVTEMQDGTGAGGEVVDVLTDVVDVGKGVVKVFDSLPGPVKKYGAELAIVALALNKVNDVGRSWIGTLPATEEGLSRSTRAYRKFGTGLRNVAGAGGMLAIVDGAKRSNAAVGTLETTLGGAAAGFAVGGPVGAAVGGLAGGLFGLYKAATRADDAAKDMIPSWKEFASTLDGATAATTRETRALALEGLQKSGVLRLTESLNISDRTAVQATLGNEAARKKLSAALADATAKGKGYQALEIARKMGLETTAIYDSRVAQLKKNKALAATKEEAQKIQAKLDKLARTNATARVKIGGADVAIQKLNAVLQLMHDISSSKGGNAQLPRPGSLLGQLDGRAVGGPVLAGQPYIVGEKRPELFVPETNGRIIPRVPTTTISATSGIDAEQSAYRAFTRALADTRTVILSKPDVEALDLLVGAS